MADNLITPSGTVATDEIGGVNHQRVKIQHGAPDSATDVSTGSPLPVETELPAAAALSDALANPTTPLLGAAGLGWEDSVGQWERLRVAPKSIQALASAVRTATVFSPDIVNRNMRGIVVMIDVTAFGGGGGLRIAVGNIFASLGSVANYAFNSPVIGATGQFTMEVAPGALSESDNTLESIARRAGVIGRELRIRVAHTDAVAHTYSVHYLLTP
jgi:hypothetical protein